LPMLFQNLMTHCSWQHWHCRGHWHCRCGSRSWWNIAPGSTGIAEVIGIANVVQEFDETLLLSALALQRLLALPRLMPFQILFETSKNFLLATLHCRGHWQCKCYRAFTMLSSGQCSLFFRFFFEEVLRAWK
jgi:hypothetical protein